MELKFLGRGSAFNPMEGNTSAYFISNDELFIIDCGENIFERLMSHNLLITPRAIHVLITHTHSDHIGSLGTLVMYCHYIRKDKLNIITQNNKYLPNVQKILDAVGCGRNMYEFKDVGLYNNKYDEFSSIKFYETKHSAHMDCYGILFNTDNGVVYYTGDTSDSALLRSIIDSNRIDKIYTDATSDDYPDNPHMYVGILNVIIPNELRNKVYCMHVNNDKCISLARGYGFNVVEK